MWVVWLVVVALLLVGVVLLALGRGDGLAEQELDDVVVDLPGDRALVASDVEAVRLPLALRGYRMSEVDQVLDRLAAELALRDSEIRQLRAVNATADARATADRSEPDPVPQGTSDEPLE